MKVIAKTLATALLPLTLAGCISINGEHIWDETDWKSRQSDNRRIISQLTIGTDRSDIIHKLDTPDFSEAYEVEGDEYRILYYRTQHRTTDGKTSKDEATPLVFKNDKLIGWGNDALSLAR